MSVRRRASAAAVSVRRRGSAAAVSMRKLSLIVLLYLCYFQLSSNKAAVEVQGTPVCLEIFHQPLNLTVLHHA